MVNSTAFLHCHYCHYYIYIIKLIEKDFSKTDVPLDQIPDLAQDRPRWRAFTNRLELAHANVRGD